MAELRNFKLTQSANEKTLVTGTLLMGAAFALRQRRKMPHNPSNRMAESLGEAECIEAATVAFNEIWDKNPDFDGPIEKVFTAESAERYLLACCKKVVQLLEG
jgi:hypothetical protein